MSNIDELPDLAGDVRDRAVPPPYEQVTRRVRARRLRTATGTMAAAVITVGGIAVWQNAATTASPSPAPPITQPADPAYPASPAWRQVVDGTDSHPFETEGTDDGSIAVVWRALEHPEPTFALVIREPDGTVHGRRLDAPVSLTPVPGGWVGLHTARAWFISSDGTWTELGAPGPSREAARRETCSSTGQYGQRALLPRGPDLLYGCRLGAAGRRLRHARRRPATCQSNGRNEIFVSPCRQSCVRGSPGDTCVIAGNGDDLADRRASATIPTAASRMTGLMTTRRTTPGSCPRMTDMLDGVTSVIVTPGGSTVVTDASTGDWYLIGADGARPPEPDRKVGEAFVAGDRLYVTSYGFMNGPLFYSDDDGRTWHETTLPGNESKRGLTA